MPLWLLIALMSIATYRLTRLVVKDDFPPVLWMRDRMVGGWRPLTSGETVVYRSTRPKLLASVGTERPEPPVWTGDVMTDDDGTPRMRYVHPWKWVPQWLADLLSCPWCASGWIALGVTVGVAFTVGVPAPVLVWPAVWGAGALIAAREWS